MTKSCKLLEVALVLAASVACGGSAVLEEAAGAGGAGGGPGPGVIACDDHDDCPAGWCVFASGQCGAPCEPVGNDSPAMFCGAGVVCDGCATSSCPGCKDCIAACVPAGDACDDHSDCGPDGLCTFYQPYDPFGQRCEPACDGPGAACPDECAFCAPCGTASCAGCGDCVASCTC